MRYLEFPLREDGTATLSAYVLDPHIRFNQCKTRPGCWRAPVREYSH